MTGLARIPQLHTCIALLMVQVCCSFVGAAKAHESHSHGADPGQEHAHDRESPAEVYVGHQQSAERVESFRVNLTDNERILDNTLEILLDEAIGSGVISSAPEPHGPLFELGKFLFYSKLLGADEGVACASCHHPSLGGADQLSLPVGVDAVDPEIIGPGRAHDGDRAKDPFSDGTHNVPRNTPTIFNVHLYSKTMFWDGRIEFVDYMGESRVVTPDSIRKMPEINTMGSLASIQAMFPLVSSNEMFGREHEQNRTHQQKRDFIVTRIQRAAQESSSVEKLFTDAFNIETPADITIEMVAESLSVFQTSMEFLDSPWYQYLSGDKNALSVHQKKGAILFYLPIDKGGYGCNACHRGSNFSDEEFHNLALPQIGRGVDTKGFDIGRMLQTSDEQDKFAFRTPSLLNVAETGPYGHNGAFLSLGDIIRHHADVESSVLAYDYSLKDLPQFANVNHDSEKHLNITLMALEAMRGSDSWAKLRHDRVEPVDIGYLSQFLRSLTDPCVKNDECLERWLPGGFPPELHSWVLDFQFSSYEDQPVTWEPPDAVTTESHRGPNSSAWFTDYTTEAGLDYRLPPQGSGDMQHAVSAGVAAGDFNGDGAIDVFVSHGLHRGKLFENAGDGSFVEVTDSALEDFDGNQFSALFIDYDADDDNDLVLVTDSKRDNFTKVYENTGDGLFVLDPSSAGLKFGDFTHSLAAADYDLDGDLDLFATHWAYSPENGHTGYLWRNDGGSFSDVSSEVPKMRLPNHDQAGDMGMSFTPIFSDIDNDDDQDLLIAGDFNTSQVLINTGGKFADATAADISDENGMGASVGDIDNDGDMDWFVTSIWNPVEHKGYTGGESGNRLYRNDGRGNLADVTDQASVRNGYWGWGSCMADFNNDGWLDIYHTNGMSSLRAAEAHMFAQFSHDPDRLFINRRDGTFDEQSFEAGVAHNGQGRGVSCFDYDGDGGVDIFVARHDKGVKLFKNLIRENVDDKANYISLALRGPSQNHEGVGTKIKLITNDNEQYREIRLSSNYLSNDPPLVHFGLAEATTVDRIDITWPDGSAKTLRNVETNRSLVITHTPDDL